MLTLLKQENYKILKSNNLKIWTTIFFLYMILVTWIYHLHHEGSLFLKSLGNSPLIISILMAVFTSTIISKEFYMGTIKILLSRQYNRIQIFVSKLITLFELYVLYYVLSIVFTLSAKLIIFSHTNLSYFTNNLDTHISRGSFYILLLSSSILLINTIIQKGSSFSITAGIIFIFVSQFLGTFISLITKSYSYLKWEPFNFFLIGIPNQTVKEMDTLTHLSTSQLYIGAILYSILFITIAVYIFNKKDI